MNARDDHENPSCSIGVVPDISGVRVVGLAPQPPLTDYLQAMDLANREAQARLTEPMMLSWYDRDRDFESPQHKSECHLDGAVPGYVDYGLNHGASLKVDIEAGRLVFFYLEAD